MSRRASPCPASLDDLPKHKRRWLRRAIDTVLDDESFDLAKIYVSIGLAFASNRRNEATAGQIRAWLEAHSDDMPRLASALAREMLPAEALARAEAAKTAPTEGEFIAGVQDAAVIMRRHFLRADMGA